jgi:hypothetical protein
MSFTQAQELRRHFLLKEVRALEAHDARMANGCLVCGCAIPGRVCPDCYVCIACAPKCDECMGD